ncbi:putative enzyme of heme biosynthesis [Belliella baltica DSM 15883]|uniref:Putative enzyme of heme biosynthesis n=1 Tax=Belliella baltica (strain DSM 15883 / CIP 108006 / LMG 21964 / BA134) TaxID=866536 RepID=I3Z8B3_BELBD|nr:tetratricopeptide repeat protein [Belliella baltica]AFL85481.1 putative enzyme of heme biosynthesis [Belliella baltica DSM 15883]
MKYIFFTFLFFSSFWVIGQEIYELDAEERNNSIVVTKTAEDMISSGKYESAAKILETVFEKDPTFHPAYVNYYNAIRNIPQKTDKLIEALNYALDIFEEDDELAYYLGNIYQEQKEFEKAIKAYSSAIAYSKINGEDFPIVWAYHFNRGNCHLKTKQFENAIVDYTYALKLSPDNSDILTNRGISNYQANKKMEACEDWKESKRLGSNAVDRYISNFCN